MSNKELNLDELKIWKGVARTNNRTLRNQIGLRTDITISADLSYIFSEKRVLIKHSDDFSLIYLQPPNKYGGYKLSKCSKSLSFRITCNGFIAELKKSHIRMGRYTPELIDGGLLIRTERDD